MLEKVVEAGAAVRGCSVADEIEQPGEMLPGERATGLSEHKEDRALTMQHLDHLDRG